jgi:anti-sigma factor RsiW
MTMTHHDTIDAFVDHASGRLSPAEHAAVDRHLAECGSCRSAYALLALALTPQPANLRFTADPFLPTRIRALAEERAGRRTSVPVLRWSFASAAFGVAIVIGILLGRDLSNSTTVETVEPSDVVSEFASSLTPTDIGDQWSSAVGSEGGNQP